MTRPCGRRGPHALYSIGTSASLIFVYNSVEIWQPCVWCCCCCCGDEKYRTTHGCLVNSPVSSHLWGIWTVKATDELCTRTFAVHTLKSSPTKCLNSPTGEGQTPPDGGSSSPPKAPPPVAPPLNLICVVNYCAREAKLRYASQRIDDVSATCFIILLS